MYLLDGKPLSPDRAFTHAGIQYPANWLRLSTLAEKQAIGITEVPDPPTWDQRFYWGYDADGKLIPKDHGQLVQQWVEQTRTTANTMLTPSDWMIVRQADNGAEVPLEVKAYRQMVREKCGQKVTTIEATTSTDELAAYVTGPDYPVWFAPEPTPSADTIDFSGSTTSAGII